MLHLFRCSDPLIHIPNADVRRMVCRCRCGNEYGFDPIGHWVCHSCGVMNDAGPYGGERTDEVLEPDRADALVREGKEFAGRADAAVRRSPDSWEAWYALGATYASRGNVFEAGLVWTRAAAVAPQEELPGLVGRCAELMSGCILMVTKAGGKCNVPYAFGLERLCLRRGIEASLCIPLYRSLSGTVASMVPRDAFAMRNLASLMLLQRIQLLPDMRDHVPLLRMVVDDADSFVGAGPGTLNPLRRAVSRKSGEYTSMLVVPYRLALSAAESALSGIDGDEAGRLASVQPDDGTAGFTDLLSKAVKKGSEVAYLRASRAKGDEIRSAEEEMRGFIDGYVSAYMAGDPAPVHGNRVYTGI